MNPLTNMKNLNKMNELELKIGVAGDANRSWHQKYRNSAWIFVGGLSYDLSEGDVICAFSQYGEVVNINLVRDQKTGKSKGFCFLCYEDQRSTILAVDNLNGIKLANRTIRVDHVEEYRVPKLRGNEDPEKLKLLLEGCAPEKPPLPKEAEDVETHRKKKRSKDKKHKDKEKKKKHKVFHLEEVKVERNVATTIVKAEPFGSRQTYTSDLWKFPERQLPVPPPDKEMTQKEMEKLNERLNAMEGNKVLPMFVHRPPTEAYVPSRYR